MIPSIFIEKKYSKKKYCKNCALSYKFVGGMVILSISSLRLENCVWKMKNFQSSSNRFGLIGEGLVGEGLIRHEENEKG